MTRPKRQDVVSRIRTDLGDLKGERSGLQERLRVVEELIQRYELLLAPPGTTPNGKAEPKAAAPRSRARQQRRDAILRMLNERDEAATSDIIEYVTQALPHENVTRSAVVDVLRQDPSFVNARRGFWRLRPEGGDDEPAEDDAEEGDDET